MGIVLMSRVGDINARKVGRRSMAESLDPPGSQVTADFYAGAVAGATVLLVDDDTRNIFALTVLLERGKLNVVPAESGLMALAILDQEAAAGGVGANSVDVVLMDIMMPGMDGYETMRAIRERPRFADLPIIALTAKVAHGERERCLAAGASDYIPKPVKSAELMTALTGWLTPDAQRAPLTT